MLGSCQGGCLEGRKHLGGRAGAKAGTQQKTSSDTELQNCCELEAKITGEESSGGLSCSVKCKAPEPRAFHIFRTHNCGRRILFRLQRQALQTEENARIKAAILIWHSRVSALQSSGFSAVFKARTPACFCVQDG